MRRKSMAACVTLALVATVAAAPVTAVAVPTRADATPTPAAGTLPPTGVDDAPAVTAAATASSVGPAAGGVVAATARSDDELDHDAREALYGVVDERPGVHLARAASLADVDLSTARYHVRVLERANLVDSEHQLGKRRLYAAGHAEDRAVAAAATDPTLGPVVRAVAGETPATVPSVADSVNSAESTVSHHLGRLADAGVVDRERADGTVRFSLVESEHTTVEGELPRAERGT